MERSVIRERPVRWAMPFPDYATEDGRPIRTTQPPSRTRRKSATIRRQSGTILRRRRAVPNTSLRIRKIVFT